uniref:Uncharacterized protein n=1 Tax=Sphaeramia orbicularis TaxID=375764 RepID=A0A673BVW5_9TELE
MPFGCLTVGEKKDYHNPSDVTDKYDLGQIVKSEEFCEIFRAKDKTTMKMYTCKKFLKKDGRKLFPRWLPPAGGEVKNSEIQLVNNRFYRSFLLNPSR